MRRTAEGYVFTTAFSRTLAGTLQEFKFVIRRADKRPVIDVHPRTPTRWTDGYRSILRLNVGTTRIKGFTNLTANASVRIERDERFAQTAPARVEGASPRDPKAGATFPLRVPRTSSTRRMLKLKGRAWWRSQLCACDFVSLSSI